MEKAVDLKKTEVAIIGGGLTGLVTAFWLTREDVDTVMLEKSCRPGGVIRTFRENGFVYESGPNTGVISHPEVPELFDELEGLCELEPADEKAKKRLIWKNGAWHPLPSGPLEAINTPLFSTRDKLGILLEPFRKKGSDPLESLEDMVKRRLGQSFLDYAVDPFISGIYAGDPSRLIPKFALPKLYALEQNYGSFIRGAIAKKFEKKGEREKRVTREVFSVIGGLEKLVSALEAKTGNERVMTGISDLSVTPCSEGYQLRAIRDGADLAINTKFVVSTVGPYEFDTLFPFLNRNQLAILNKLEYASIIQVVMGFKKWQGMNLNAFGGLVPGKEKMEILGILFPSSFLRNRAPEGGALLSVFLGGFRNPGIFSLPDDEIIEKAVTAVKSMLQVENCNPGLLKIYRYKNAIPQYMHDTPERLAVTDHVHSSYPGLLLAGNMREGIGMADRIRQGKILADSIVAALQQQLILEKR